jgi:2-polyprenyl-6-methoxyphenol hydroxylase-like FAD-dependent oxidoreductase
MTEHDILVRGAGAVGLAAALALSRQGLRVALVGASAPLAASDVRAFALNPASVRMLTELKVWDALPSAARTAVHDMRIEGDAAGGSLDFSAWQQGLAELAWIVDAPALEQALRSAAGFSPHITVLDPHQALPTVALQVVAEGKHSALREGLGVQWVQRAYGHSAIAARLVCEQAHANTARQWFRCPDVLALLPLDQPQPGGGYALVWSLPQARAQALMDDTDEAFAAQLCEATQGLAGPLQLAGPRSTWPLVQAQASTVHGAGWVLVGDAAHVVHPLAGQGLNLGLADVAALADVLAAREAWRGLGDARLLGRYARQRWAATRSMAQLTDGLLQLFAAPNPVLRRARNVGLSLVNQLSPVKRFLVNRAGGA